MYSKIDQFIADNTVSEEKIYTPKDFSSDQEVRWCPGCGDYSILKQVQTIMPQLGHKKEDIVFISGIGCSSRFPYYMDTYGMHSIHGRAATIATGLKSARPELSVWLITGDGDALSIGGNHTIHMLRRNVDVNILLFNNQIYGLTKGQYSPTSEIGKITKSTPMGSIDFPFNPLALALGADATFIARTLDRDPKHLQNILIRGDKHRGSSFIEIYQNCNVFNDGAFEMFTDKESKSQTTILLEQGQPLIFNDKKQGIRLDGYKPVLVSLEDNKFSTSDLWLHDETDYFKASLLTRFFDTPLSLENTEILPRPIGVLYAIEKPTYNDLLNNQLNHAKTIKGEPNLDALLKGVETWKVG